MDGDDVGAVLVAAVPGALQEVEAREHDIWAAHEDLEQGKALARDLDLLLSPPHPTTGWIDPQRADLENGGPLDLSDRKSTRLNSSHTVISYAVFCLKKKKIYH